MLFGNFTIRKMNFRFDQTYFRHESYISPGYCIINWISETENEKLSNSVFQEFKLVYQFLSGGRVAFLQIFSSIYTKNMGILLAKLWNLFGNEGKQFFSPQFYVYFIQTCNVYVIWTVIDNDINTNTMSCRTSLTSRSKLE